MTGNRSVPSFTENHDYYSSGIRLTLFSLRKRFLISHKNNNNIKNSIA